MSDVTIGHRPDAVILRVPVDQRRRTLLFDPHDAIQVANQIATSAVALLDTPARAEMRADQIQLRPYGSGGEAKLAFFTEHGPFIIQISAATLMGLATAAQAALEFAEPSGKG